MEPYAKLKPLVKNGGSIKKIGERHIKESINNLAAALRKVRGGARFDLGIIEGTSKRTYCFVPADKTYTVTQDAAGEPEFEVITDLATAAEMAKGMLSPVDAFLTGKMEVRGNLELGKRLFAAAASRGGETSI